MCVPGLALSAWCEWYEIAFGQTGDESAETLKYYLPWV